MITASLNCISCSSLFTSPKYVLLSKQIRRRLAVGEVGDGDIILVS